LKIGILLPSAGQQATRHNIIQTASLAEKERFDSIWAFERLLWPLNPQTPYAGTPDGSLPVEYQTVFDPLETLTFVAANTKKITLGTSVIDMLFHNPVILARRLATLDVLSEGRAICGLGIGWSKDEYQVSTVPFENKGKRANEFVQVLKKIWTKDVVEFKGQYYYIPASKIGPKPIQKPHIPLFLSAIFSPSAFRRIVKHDANGWLGVVAGPFESIKNGVKLIRDEATKENKDPSKFQLILLTYPNIIGSSYSSNDSSQRFPLTGTIDEVGSDIQRIKQMGIDHIIFGYNFLPTGRDINKTIDITKQLSKFAK
jgi:probable F420-dependent oxidoreductase